MTLADEEKYMGRESHEVPQIDPGETCNAKTTKKTKDEDRGTIHVFDGYCGNKAGKGTEHVGEGRCKFHGGSINEGDGEPGAPDHNQNAAKHSLNADPHHYAEDLDQAEQDWLLSTTEAILDRIRKNHGRDPDFLDRILARRVAINLHIVSKASEYSRDELVQVIVHDGSSHEEPGALVEEVRRYSNSIFKNLKELGVMEDPDSQQADAVEQWKSFIEAEQKSQ